jgi:bifunctional N-acetylglucosamine-1-phosphate-uridyltransferase/glucosamine-1-phosphate-acetyltransferase GlmU-like protein
MKKLILGIVITPLNHLFFPKWMKKQKFDNQLLIFKCGFSQKILRRNSHVSWPVNRTSEIKSPENIDPGSRAPGLSLCCYIDGRNGIRIGDNVWIGPRVSLISMNHDDKDYSKFVKDKPIIIGDNCLLTANSVILPGVELGANTIVASGAIVSKSFPEGNVVLGGIPAKVIKTN